MNETAKKRFVKDAILKMREEMGLSNEELLSLLCETLPDFIPSAADRRLKQAKKHEAVVNAAEHLNTTIHTAFLD